MIHSSSVKVVSITRPAAIIDNAAVTTAFVDTLGFDHALIFVDLGATDIALTVLKVQESDASGSGYADVTGLVFGTSTDIAGAATTLPSATDDNKFYLFDINLQGRKRYLDLNVTVGDGTVGGFLTAYAVLSRAEQSPTTAAERGGAVVLRA